jgi:hypothetical protein
VVWESHQPQRLLLGCQERFSQKSATNITGMVAKKEKSAAKISRGISKVEVE